MIYLRNTLVKLNLATLAETKNYLYFYDVILKNILGYKR
jgi:hypothetical protein